MGRYIPRYDIDEKLLIRLRNEGLTYRQISDYIEVASGIRVSIPTICKRIKELGIVKSDETKKQIPEKRLKELREQGLTYKEISEHLTSNGNEISLGLARKKIKEIYRKEGKTEPKAKYKKSPELEQITDEELQELRKMGLGARRIQLYYNEKGIDVSRQWIWLRVKSIEEKQAKSSLPSTRENAKSKIIEKILELETSKKATPMQMRKMAQLYGVEVEFEDKVNETGKEEHDEEDIGGH